MAAKIPGQAAAAILLLLLAAICTTPIKGRSVPPGLIGHQHHQNHRPSHPADSIPQPHHVPKDHHHGGGGGHHHSSSQIAPNSSTGQPEAAASGRVIEPIAYLRDLSQLDVLVNAFLDALHINSRAHTAYLSLQRLEKYHGGVKAQIEQYLAQANPMGQQNPERDPSALLIVARTELMWRIWSMFGKRAWVSNEYFSDPSLRSQMDAADTVLLTHARDMKSRMGKLERLVFTPKQPEKQGPPKEKHQTSSSSHNKHHPQPATEPQPPTEPNFPSLPAGALFGSGPMPPFPPSSSPPSSSPPPFSFSSDPGPLMGGFYGPDVGSPPHRRSRVGLAPTDSSWEPSAPTPWA